MSIQTLARTKTIQSRTDIEGFESLAKLSLNLLWSWKHCGDKIWEQIDSELWEQTRNPWVVLQTVSQEKLVNKLADPSFRKMVNDFLQDQEQTFSSPGWFQETYPKSPLKSVAYFSMEFMLSEALPIYSGGLGNVAGDQLKSASDLGVPVTAVGLLYQQGYFRQMIDKEGNQQALYPYNDPGQLPITPLRKPNGEWLRIKITLPDTPIWIRTWEVQVGRTKLYLLDSNDPANLPIHRGITSELYGGDSELRLKQEILLGIGGWRLLEAMEIKPEVCHLNEGHAAFAVLERALSFMKTHQLPFSIALTATRAGNLFTTHTAVPAGFDRFPPFLIEHYLGNYAKKELGISINELLAMGRLNPKDNAEPFNMAYLAIHGCGAVNGVSHLHKSVSQRIFDSLFLRWPEREIPVGYVTNGVHMPSWDSAEADAIWTETCGKSRWLGKTENLGKGICKLSDSKIWQMRNESRQSLVLYARKRLKQQLAARGATISEIEVAKQLFDPNTLTLGFARRFATYKRPNMLLEDTERLLRILTNPQRPVQLIIAGKAHPADRPGQTLIKEWMQFIRRPEARTHVIFLTDYDMGLTEHLVQGVDVWINTPRRPWEASGTSGMKVLVNGGLNLSELDGWWAEAYSPDVGWALGDGQEHEHDYSWDSQEASKLYDLLEKEIIPLFYNRDSEGIPPRWVSMIRESMSRLTPQFSANRSVRQYTEQYYLKAAASYYERAANQAKRAKEIDEWKRSLEKSWALLRFGDIHTKTTEQQHFFEIQVYLDDLDPRFVKVELYADGTKENPPICQEMSLVRQLPNSPGLYVYEGAVSANRSISDFAPRVIPQFEDVSVPLEASQILWQH